MPVLPESMVWSAVCRVRGVVAAMVVVVVLLGPGCASSDDRGSGIDLGVGTTAVATSIPQGDDGVQVQATNREEDVSEVSPFEVRVASGYLRDLLDTEGGMGFDYSPLIGASDALGETDIVVAGYLFDVVAGATEADVSVHRPLTSAQVERRLAELDERERSFESLGATEGDWLELESQRRAARENEPRKRYDDNYAAYRVRVTEVFKGDINVGDVLDVQVFAGVNVASEWVAPVLKGTPRVVVAVNWDSTPFRYHEFRDWSGQVIEGVYWPMTDLFWLDEGVWDILVDGTSEGTSVVDETNTGEPGVPGSVPGGLVDDTPQLGVTVVTEENLTERPAPIPEAHYLAGLHELDEAWGVLETLDDLAAALRTAAAEASGSSTTTTGSETTP